MSRVVHFEILAEHPEQMAKFYEEALGWSIQKWEGPETYWLFMTGPDGSPGINGGMMQRQFPQSVVNTVQVVSLEETIAKIERAGGKKVFGPHEIPGIGTHAYCADPEGTMFGILQPAPM